MNDNFENKRNQFFLNDGKTNEMDRSRTMKEHNEKKSDVLNAHLYTEYIIFLMIPSEPIAKVISQHEIINKKLRKNAM